MWRRRNLLALIFSGLAVSIGASCSSSGDGEKVELRLRLEKGESHRLRWTSNQTIRQTLPDQRQLDVEQAFGMGFTLDVQDVDAEGTGKVRVTYHAVTFEQDNPLEGKIAFDSASPPEKPHPLTMGLAGLVGQSFTMTLTSKGKVTSVEGVDAMLANVLESIDAPVPGLKQVMKEKMKQQFGDEALKKVMENMMAIYPDGPVAVGDTWSNRIDVATGFAMSIENTFTLKALEDDVAIVMMESKVRPNPDAEAIDMGIMKMRYELSGTQQGEMELDLKTGWPKRQELTQDLSGTVHVEGGMIPGQSGQSWPIAIQSDIRVEPE
ncbi:MAG TPA: DUF6263 family protein [Thermoguttaceae bacterium]|nr:DUF6263 family protein [Thermoguttaceae bacterium]